MKELYMQYADKEALYSYWGEVSQEILESIITEVNEKMENEEILPRIRSCVYSALVEGIQNMVRYCYVREGEPMQGMVVVLKEKIGLRIILGNYISKKQEANMIYQLEKFNFMTREELKDKLNQNRKTNALRENSSAGLGLMEIARRASGKLKYQMLDRGIDYSIFLLEVVI